ncbi:hypothetical protein [Fusobacterium varium]
MSRINVKRKNEKLRILENQIKIYKKKEKENKEEIETLSYENVSIVEDYVKVKNEIIFYKRIINKKINITIFLLISIFVILSKIILYFIYEEE